MCNERLDVQHRMDGWPHLPGAGSYSRQITPGPSSAHEYCSNPSHETDKHKTKNSQLLVVNEEHREQREIKSTGYLKAI